ncbi:MAG: hypothetical protein A2Y78_08410 [Acidobacteria bacterium RBG_13_68_16]|nr:MAG: hypothetical protein A2Y78_08410 [Acidobacteria bacterium RBG_13_68_16]
MAQHTTTLAQACGLASKAAYLISEALILEGSDPKDAHEHLRAAIQSLTLAESMLRSVTTHRKEPTP